MQLTTMGWIMWDEALVPYYDMMEQLEFGDWFLLETFGFKPHCGFDLDSFG